MRQGPRDGTLQKECAPSGIHGSFLRIMSQITVFLHLIARRFQAFVHRQLEKAPRRPKIAPCKWVRERFNIQGELRAQLLPFERLRSRHPWHHGHNPVAASDAELGGIDPAQASCTGRSRGRAQSSKLTSGVQGFNYIQQRTVQRHDCVSIC